MNQRRDDVVEDLYNKIERLEGKSDESFMEKYFQPIMVTIMTGAIIACASFMYNTGNTLAVVQTQLTTLSAQFVDLKTKMETMQNNYVDKSDFNQLETRVRILETSKSRR